MVVRDADAGTVAGIDSSLLNLRLDLCGAKPDEFLPLEGFTKDTLERPSDPSERSSKSTNDATATL